MNGFEAFDINAWLVDELFTSTANIPRRPTRKERRQGGAVHARIVLPLVGAVAALQFVAPVASAQPYARGEAFSLSQSISSSDPDVIPGDPGMYWATAIREFRNRPRIVESDSPDIDTDPLF